MQLPAGAAVAPSKEPRLGSRVSALPPRRYPLFLERKRFRGTFHFKDTYTLVDHTLDEVDSLQLPAEPLE